MRLRLILTQDCILIFQLNRQDLHIKLDVNEFRGNRNVQLLVEYIEAIDE